MASPRRNGTSAICLVFAAAGVSCPQQADALECAAPVCRFLGAAHFPAAPESASRQAGRKAGAGPDAAHESLKLSLIYLLDLHGSNFYFVMQ